MRRTHIAATPPAAPSIRRPASFEKVFTFGEIRRALPYVQRVLADASAAYERVQRIRKRLANCPGHMGHARLAEERDAAVVMLNRTIDEFHLLGISYIDIPRARVGFRVEIEGQPASVEWRLGEPCTALEAEDGE